MHGFTQADNGEVVFREFLALLLGSGEIDLLDA